MQRLCEVDMLKVLLAVALDESLCTHVHGRPLTPLPPPLPVGRPTKIFVMKSQARVPGNQQRSRFFRLRSAARLLFSLGLGVAIGACGQAGDVGQGDSLHGAVTGVVFGEPNPIFTLAEDASQLSSLNTVTAAQLSTGSATTSPTYSAADVLAALKAAHGRFVGPIPPYLDANLDGAVTVEDAKIILQRALTTGVIGNQNNINSSGIEVLALTKVMDYSNERKVGQVFNTKVVDINGDGLEDVVLAGWAIDASGQSRSSFVPLKILIQGQDGLLVDKTSLYIEDGKNYIYGAQRIIVEDFDGDGRPDIFLGGFQDQGSAIPAPSVIFWNDGNSFSRFDFTENVWAHAACTGDVFGLGRKDIVMGGNERRPYTIYKNKGGRVFELVADIANLSVTAAGACSVIRDETTGNVAIISTNMVGGLTHSGVVTVLNSQARHLATRYLPGSEEVNGWDLVHDLVNVIRFDLNGDGLMDIILTDNGDFRLYRPVGRFVALVNQGDFIFIDKTQDYFPTQTNDYVFGYYHRIIEIDGLKNLFIGNAAVASTTSLWRFDGGRFSPYLSERISGATSSARAYITVYKTKSGALYLLMQRSERFGEFEFHVKRI